MHTHSFPGQLHGAPMAAPANTPAVLTEGEGERKTKDWPAACSGSRRALS